MKLNAGQLTILYEQGVLRSIRAMDTELIRMIYFAVRDDNWDTMSSRIEDEEICNKGNEFKITYRCLVNERGIRMRWEVLIEGKPDNSIFFDIRGTALTDFFTNRSGLCILHPIEECRGKPCLITDPKGIKEIRYFPDVVAPHQIFWNIREMLWHAAPGLSVRLQLSGDVFETEDHRNWTDHSFKTYCTPLDRPFPVYLTAGSSIHQSVIVTCPTFALPTYPSTIADRSIPGKEAELSHAWITLTDQKLALPAIGICRPDTRRQGWQAALPFLKSIRFSHYRVELHMSEQDWHRDWEDGSAEATVIGAPLEIVMLFSGEFRQECAKLVELASEQESEGTGKIFYTRNIRYILILGSGAEAAIDELIKLVIPLLKSLFPGVPIGSGTNAYFAELNRSSIDADLTDFLSFSLHPQVHAFDDRTIIENMEAQGEVLVSARKKFPGKAIHVSPVTLRKRSSTNTNGTSAGSVNENRGNFRKNEEGNADDRQSTMFIAGWTLGSIKYLSENGASSISYYEATGEKGVVGFEKDGQLCPFPLLGVLEQILNNGWEEIQLSRSNRPHLVSSLILCSKTEKAVMVANHSSTPIMVSIHSKCEDYAEAELRSVLLNAYEIQLIKLEVS